MWHVHQRWQVRRRRSHEPGRPDPSTPSSVSATHQYFLPSVASG
jgi:hypothetical protein